jgi:uncharacterized protein YndB with AHSA1/START domain
MITFDLELQIARPPEDVFPYLEDPEKVVQWQSTAVEIRQDGDGPRGAGTRFRDVRKFLGRTIDSSAEFTDYDPPRALGVRTTAPMPFLITQRLEPVDGGTRLSVHAEGEGGGFFKLAEPMVARAARRQLRADFEALKRLLEPR